MASPDTPSDALAAVAGALHELECSGRQSDTEMDAWLSVATKRLVEDDEEGDAAPEWQLEPEQLFAATISAIPSWPPPPPANVDEFTSYSRALQALDRWHRPLVASCEREPLPKLDAHYEAQDRLMLESCFGSARAGVVVPGYAWGHVPSHETEPAGVPSDDPLRPFTNRNRPMVLRTLLDVTAFLPNALAIPSADGDAGEGRHVRVRYIIKPMPKNLPQREPNAPFRVAIAPLLETGEDLAITLSACGGWYSVRPTYSRERLTATLQAALKLRAELLFLPECTVSDEHLNWLQSEILTIARSYFETRGELPSLRYVFAGVASSASDPSAKGANYITVLDSAGREICRQDKLFRWNLNEDQIRRYGLDVELNTNSDEIKENITSETEVYVLDLEDIGRFITLICADVSENAPGDWLLAHVRTDWLNAPIMDKSTCWTFDPRGLHGPWITRRAYRAACASQCKVVVSNSMALTDRLNRTNQRLGIEMVLSQCGIGLLLDGSGATVTFRQVTTPLRAESPIVVAELWKNNWNTVGPVIRASGRADTGGELEAGG